jgi:hypothetical protein
MSEEVQSTARMALGVPSGMANLLTRPSKFQGAMTCCALNGLDGSPKQDASIMSISPLY